MNINFVADQKEDTSRNFGAKMIYNDDEPILEQINTTDDDDFKLYDEDAPIKGYAEGRIFNKAEAPMVESQFKVLLELKGVVIDGRLPVDIVTVLDISRSMKGTKLTKTKLAMQFLLQKLGRTDRLSVVTFYDIAHRLCPLRQITESSRTEIADMVNALEIGPGTNTEAGLKMALEILKHRTHFEGRFVAIMLMSDGDENGNSHSANVSVDQVPVYTFGFGTNYNPEVLSIIANNSDGGMFAPVAELDDLTVAFSGSLAGLLNVAIEDLTLTITPDKGSKITRVNAGKYQQTKGNEVHPAVTVTFRSLYDQETRKVLVTLTLPEVDSKRSGADYVKMKYTYRVGGKDKSDEVFVNVSRISTENEAEKEEVVAEEKRIRTANSIKEARLLADAKKLEEARKKLEDAKTSLSEVDAILTAQLDQLLLFMVSQATYEKQGRAFALALEASHDSQRGGTVDSKLDMFNTRLTNLYREQAESFDKDPKKPVGPDPSKPIQPDKDPKKILLQMIDKVVAFMKDTAGKIKESMV